MPVASQSMFNAFTWKAWDLQNFRCVATLREHIGSIFALLCVDFHLFSASSDSTVRVRTNLDHK
jgi:WD40 repeat protein